MAVSLGIGNAIIGQDKEMKPDIEQRSLVDNGSITARKVGSDCCQVRLYRQMIISWISFVQYWPNRD